MMMCRVNFYCLYVVISLLALFASAQVEPVFSSDEGHDNEREVQCAGCLAVVDIVEKHMKRKPTEGVESEIYEVLEDICHQKNFPSYDFIPPKMIRVCQSLIDEIDEEVLANYLTKHYQQKNRSLAALERAVCLKMSGFCIGSERIDVQADKEKAKKAKGKKTTAKEDKEFDENVDELIKKHSHKLKQPRPVKTEL